MSKQRVTDQELGAILRDVKPDSSPASEADGYSFHRIQSGYHDKISRAVFIDVDEEPYGVPMPPSAAPLLLLVARLAADLQDARGQRHAFKEHLKIAYDRNTKLEDVLRRIVGAWREDDSDQIISEALIEEAEKLLDIEAKPDPLAAESAEPAR